MHVQVPLELYKSSMAGVRKYLVRHVWDGQEESSIVSEAKADIMRGTIGDTSNRFEHLTCFAGGMFILGGCVAVGLRALPGCCVLAVQRLLTGTCVVCARLHVEPCADLLTACLTCAGALHNVSTEVDADDFHDVVLGARIGRACYELYHQAASGLAPDSVTYKQANGQPLPPRDQDTVRAPGIIKHRPGQKCVHTSTLPSRTADSKSRTWSFHNSDTAPAHTAACMTALSCALLHVQVRW